MEEQAIIHKNRKLWPFIKRIFGMAMLYRKPMILLFVGCALAALTEALFPVLWQQYIDNWISPLVEQSGQGSDWVPGFVRYTSMFLILFLVEAISIWLFIRSSGQIKEYVIYDLRNQMFERLQYLSHSFYDKNSIGHLSIRLTEDVKKVSEVVSFGLVRLIWGTIMIIASLIIMFIYNWVLSILVMLSIPLLTYLAIKVRVSLLKYARQARYTYSQMAAYLTEHINGLEVNKATVQEERASENFFKVSERLRFASYKSAYYSSMYYPIVVVSGSLAAALVISLGGQMVLGQTFGITVGILAAFFGYARLIFEPIFDITSYYATAQDSLSAGERIFSLIDEPLTIHDKIGVEPFMKLKGEIEFEGVGFHYTEDKPILENFNLRIPAGQSVAIVGHTGSGKSTLAGLISRFYEPQSGKILIDGVEYRDKSLHSYRSRLGVILQTPHLFSGTLRENLKYGKLDASDAEIKEALSLAGIPEFFTRLNESVGEEGSEYSEGEKQLISFARAILRDPRILILDEATSSVDTISEAKLQVGVEQMIKDRTSIIIAHRLSTIRHCDRIIVMEHGKIIEDGSHEELIAKGGTYHGLYMHQARM